MLITRWSFLFPTAGDTPFFKKEAVFFHAASKIIPIPHYHITNEAWPGWWTQHLECLLSLQMGCTPFLSLSPPCTLLLRLGGGASLPVGCRWALQGLIHKWWAGVLATRISSVQNAMAHLKVLDCMINNNWSLICDLYCAWNSQVSLLFIL